MKKRYLAYALVPNGFFTANLLADLEAFGFAGAALLIGHSWLSVILLSGFLFSISAEAKRWRPVFIGFGILGLSVCILGSGFLQFQEVAGLGAMAFFPLCFLGWSAGILVEKSICLISYLKKNYPALRQKALDLVVSVLNDAVD